MNATVYNFDLEVEPELAHDIILATTSLCFIGRSNAKSKYLDEASLVPGTLGWKSNGIEEICFFFMSICGEEWSNYLESEIAPFVKALTTPGAPETGQLSVKFYTKRNGDWPFTSDEFTYEIFTFKFKRVETKIGEERVVFRKRLGDKLRKNMLGVLSSNVKTLYKPPYKPPRDECDNVFDTRFQEVLPNLHKIEWFIDEPTDSSSLSTAVKGLIRNTLTFG